MRQLFKFSLAALALSGIVGLAPNLASARESNQCGGHWSHCLKPNHHHSTHQTHWSHRWRDYDQRW